MIEELDSMKSKPTRRDDIRVRNFKAIRDSGAVKLTPLTVLIGNNGSGKRSLVEALETTQARSCQLQNELVASPNVLATRNCNSGLPHAEREG